MHLFRLTKHELILWIVSLFCIVLSFILVKNNDYLVLTASLIGATALIFVSKGNVVGQVLTVVFSIFYGIISYSFRYYGEMITYLGMTAPIAILSIVTWLKNPFANGKAVVRVNHLRYQEWILLLVLTALITFGFYFILKYFNTANLIVSTISVATSFLASYLTMRRSEFYAFGYALNDIILIILWALAAASYVQYLSMMVCFIIFFINDIYGFWHWSKLKKQQRKAQE